VVLGGKNAAYELRHVGGRLCQSPNEGREPTFPYTRQLRHVRISDLTMTKYLGKIDFEVAELVQPLLVSGLSDYSR
jgi:hypothetical protein